MAKMGRGVKNLASNLYNLGITMVFIGRLDSLHSQCCKALTVGLSMSAATAQVAAYNPDDVDSSKMNAIVAKQAAWDSKFEDVEKKESELMTTQWSMMREQLRSLTTDLAKAQVEIEALKKAQAQATIMFKKQLQDTDSELEKEKLDRAAGDDKLQKQIDELKKALADEAKARQADMDKLKDWVKGKIDPLEKSLIDKNNQLADALKELEKLKADVDHLTKKIDPLADGIKKEGEARKGLEDDLRKALKDLEDALKNQMRDRDAGVDAQIKALKNALDKERGDRDKGDKDLSDALKKLQKLVEPYADELKDLANKIRELDNTVHPRLNEHKKALDKSDGDRVAGHNNLAQKIADLAKKLEAEVGARAALQDDMEQMLEALRSKLRALIKEQVDAANAKTDALGHALHDELDKEKADRAAGDDSLEKEIQALKKNLDDKIKAALDNLKALEEKLRDELLDLERKGEAKMMAKVDDLAKQLASLRDAIMAFISEEDTTDESIINAEDANLEDLGKLFKDVGERFLGQYGAPRRQVKTAKRNCRTILGGLGDVAPPVPSATRDLAPPEPIKIVPKLSDDNKAKLKEILARNRVLLLFHDIYGNEVRHDDDLSEVGSAQLKLKDAIDFKPVHHGKTPTAIYKDEDKTTGVLGDIADVLSIYSSATVTIEGHTATPPEKMDSWAHELARNRADKVKETVCSHGTDPKRLSTKGCPGNLGDNHPDVKLKITGF